MGQYVLKPSFSGGELTPALWGRTDIQKYDVGAACIKNAIVLRYGGVKRREGFQYVNNTRFVPGVYPSPSAKARLIPFSYNVDQNYVLEFTNRCIRFYYQGEIITEHAADIEVSTPYTEAELPQIKYAQSADVLFLSIRTIRPRR